MTPMHERARDHGDDATKSGETAKAGVPGEALPKRRARMPQEAFSQGRPYPSTPRNRATSPPRLGRGRSLPTGAGWSLRVFPYARSLRHRPAAPCYTTRRYDRFTSSISGKEVSQHFIASMSVQLHRIRCSACSGIGVHDGWNTQSTCVSLPKRASSSCSAWRTFSMSINVSTIRGFRSSVWTKRAKSWSAK